MTEFPESSGATRGGYRPAGIDSTAPDPSSAKDKAADVAQTGKQAAGEVAQTASSAAKDVAGTAKQEAGDLVGKTKSQLTDQAVTQKGALVETLRSLGDQLAGMTDTDASGTAVDVATSAREHARNTADWLDEREPDQILDDLRGLGRREPGKFLVGALLAGVVAGRLTRGVAAVHSDDVSTPAAQGEQTPAGTAPGGRHETTRTAAVPTSGAPSAYPPGRTAQR